MQEITLSTQESLALLAVLIPLNIYLWTHWGPDKPIDRPKQMTKGDNTTKLQNDRYGAYIQLTGKRYN